jgi:hypothetical protein
MMATPIRTEPGDLKEVAGELEIAMHEARVITQRITTLHNAIAAANKDSLDKEQHIQRLRYELAVCAGIVRPRTTFGRNKKPAQVEGHEQLTSEELEQVEAAIAGAVKAAAQP